MGKRSKKYSWLAQHVLATGGTSVVRRGNKSGTSLQQHNRRCSCTFGTFRAFSSYDVTVWFEAPFGVYMKLIYLAFQSLKKDPFTLETRIPINYMMYVTLYS